MGITSKNVDGHAEKATIRRFKRFLGVTPGLRRGGRRRRRSGCTASSSRSGKLRRELRAQCRRQHARSSSRRGQNALWTNGGLMYAIPFR